MWSLVCVRLRPLSWFILIEHSVLPEHRFLVGEDAFFEFENFKIFRIFFSNGYAERDVEVDIDLLVSVGSHPEKNSSKSEKYTWIP